MALEPRTVTVDEGPNPELADMSRRFWVGLALSVPVFLLAMADMLPAYCTRCSGCSSARSGPAPR
jgi:Cu+-exporting ATPase